MKLRIQIFDDTIVICRLSDVFLNPTSIDLGVKHMILSLMDDSSTRVAVGLKSESYIKEDEIFSPHWILDALGIRTFDLVHLKLPEGVILVQDTDTILLTFVSHQSYRHWDEFGTAVSFESPLKWKRKWPSGLFQIPLENMLPALLVGNCFLNDQLIAISILDLSLMFQIKLLPSKTSNTTDENSNIDSLVHVLPLAPIFQVRVCNPYNDDIASTGNPQPRLVDPLPTTLLECEYLQVPLNKLLDICRQTLLNPVSDWRGPRTVLVSAPLGAGKTRLLDAIVRSIEQECRNAMTAVRILRLSGARDTSTILKKPEETDKNSHLVKGRARSREEADGLLVEELIRLLSLDNDLCMGKLMFEEESPVPKSVLFDGKRPLLLLLDDVDGLIQAEAVLSARDTDLDDRLSAGLTTASQHHTSSLAVLALKRLLNRLSDAACTINVVLVFATRWSKASVPAALALPPGFELQLELPQLDLEDRAAVITELLVKSDLPLAATDPAGIEGLVDRRGVISEWSRKAAELTTGFLPGDLVSVMRLVQSLYAANVSSTNESGMGKNNCLLWSQMQHAIAVTVPRQLEGLSSYSLSLAGSSGDRLTWADVGGYKEIVTILQRLLVRLQRGQNTKIGDNDPRAALLSKVKQETGGVVLYGPPACGKTFLARIFASESRANFVTVQASQLLSSSYGQTEASLRALFAKGRAAAPCILFLDDFDALACKRGLEGGSEGASGLQSRLLSTLLNELDGVGAESGKVLVMLACRSLDVLDEALLRPGRLSHHLHINYPTKTDMKSILSVRLQTMPIADDVDADSLADALLLSRCESHDSNLVLSSGVTCADVDVLCRGALYAVIREVMTDNKGRDFESVELENPLVFRRHFEFSLSNSEILS